MLAGSTAAVFLGAVLLYSIQAMDPSIKNGVRQVLGTSSTPEVLMLEKGQHKRTYTSPQFETDFEFNALAPYWEEKSVSDDTSRHVDIRVSSDGEDWTEWMELEVGPQARKDAPNPNRIAPETPLFIEGNYFQYRIELERSSLSETSPEITDLEFTYIDSRKSRVEEFRDTIQTMSSQVFAASGGPEIISRKDWGNPDPYGNKHHGTNRYWTPTYNETEQVFLHHTVTSNDPNDPEAVMRAIWDYHANTLGWGDIGYNYVLDQHGNVYEGRFGGNNVTAGHVLNYNQRSMGVAVLGCFQDNNATCNELNNGNTTPPTNATINSLVNLLSWKTTGFGISPDATHTFCNYKGSDCLNLHTIAAHRDANNTSCNGNLFYNKMDNIRQDTADKNSTDPWGYAGKQLSYDTVQLRDAEKQVTLNFKNQGTATWTNSGDDRLLLKTTNPDGRTSRFQGSGWVNDYTPAVLNEASVDPGGTGSFTFNIKRPSGEIGRDFEGLRLVSSGNTSGTDIFATTVYSSTAHPEGSLFQRPGATRVYLIENGQRRHVASRKIFDSHRLSYDYVTKGTVADIELPMGDPLDFSEGTLVQGSDAPVYAVDYEAGQIQKRHITSRSAFEDLGFSFDEVVSVSDSRLPTANGEDIDNSQIHPDGLLVREPNNPKVYLLEDGQRRHVASREMFKSHHFSFGDVRDARPGDMDLPEGSKLRFREGTLVQGSNAPVYVIAYDSGQIQKRHITSRTIFDALDFSFDNVLDIPDSQLPENDGEPIQ